MNEPYNPQPTYVPPPQSSSGGGGGCFLKGCLVVLAVALVLFVMAGAFVWYMSSVAKPFFSRSPVAVQQFEATDAQYAAVQEKLVAFNRTVAAGEKAVLRFTADDLNVLVSRDPRFADAHGKVFFSIVNNRIVTETCFPLDEHSAPGQRLYFNARVNLEASYASGDFAFRLVKVESLDGKPLPDFAANFARGMVTGMNKGFTESLRDHPERNREALDLLEQMRTIVIQDNEIVATSVDKPQRYGQPAATPAPDSSATPVAEGANAP